MTDAPHFSQRRAEAALKENASQVLPKPYSGKQICDHLIVFSGTFPAASALPPKADIGTHPRDVRFVPKADIAECGGHVW
jgi:hypothetical protein